MKIKAIVIFLSIAAAGCGSATDTASSDPSTESNRSMPVSHPADTNNEPPKVVPVKVTTPVDHKFDATGIPKGWRWIDSDTTTGRMKYDTSGGTLKIIVPSGKDMYAENRTAPHMLQTVEGDFQIETRVKFDPKEDYQGAGLFIFKDGENYLRLERAFGGVSGSGSGIRLDARTKEDYKPITTPDQSATEAKTVDLKLVRMGKKFIAFWRLDEESEWKEVGEFDSDYPDVIQVGIIACNTGAEIPVEFSYIKLAPAV